jgi:DNA-directed RNA polymerase subunit K/omega
VTLKTLLLLKRCLRAQQLNVGAPDFPEVAGDTMAALKELDEAIAQVEGGTT